MLMINKINARNLIPTFAIASVLVLGAAGPKVKALMADTQEKIEQAQLPETRRDLSETQIATLDSFHQIAIDQELNAFQKATYLHNAVFTFKNVVSENVVINDQNGVVSPKLLAEAQTFRAFLLELAGAVDPNLIDVDAIYKDIELRECEGIYDYFEKRFSVHFEERGFDGRIGIEQVLLSVQDKKCNDLRAQR